tara:strand:+ start:339 stop:638 length:300 start_codon:yes stop_codon:yes gene_type:complete
MSNKKEAIYPDGLILKKKDTDPDWVIGKLSFKVEEFIKFLTKYEKKGWVNVEMKIGKESGKPYTELDTWEPQPQGDTPKKTVAKSKPQEVESPAEDLPF